MELISNMEPADFPTAEHMENFKRYPIISHQRFSDKSHSGKDRSSIGYEIKSYMLISENILQSCIQIKC